VKSTTHLHLMLKLRMSGSIPLLLLYASMAWTRKIIDFYFAQIEIYYENEPLESANSCYLRFHFSCYGKFYIYYGETRTASKRAQV
jgi:hypothetical protein